MQSDTELESALWQTRVSADALRSLTNGDGGDVFVLLSSQISHQAAGVVPGHRAHQHRGSRFHLKTPIQPHQHRVKPNP